MEQYDVVEKLVTEIINGLNNGYRRVNLINDLMNIGPLDITIDVEDYSLNELADEIEWELLFRKETGIEYTILKDMCGTGGEYLMFRFTKEKLTDEFLKVKVVDNFGSTNCDFVNVWAQENK